MAFGGWHPRIESACILSLSRVLGKPPIHTKARYLGTLTWACGGEEMYSVQYQAELHEYWGRLDLTDSTETYSISLRTMPLHFGGRRWWMHCPFTGRRALKLYRYEAIGKFCHRTAIRPLPTYASQRVSGLDRIMGRRWAIRRKLRDEGDLFTSLQKPKWMRWDTFERYQAKDEYLDALEGTAIIQRWGRLAPNWLGN